MFQDGIEGDKLVQIVTERVTPLFNYLIESKDNQSQKENEISWGLHQIAVSYLSENGFYLILNFVIQIFLSKDSSYIFE